MASGTPERSQGQRKKGNALADLVASSTFESPLLLSMAFSAVPATAELSPATSNPCTRRLQPPNQIYVSIIYLGHLHVAVRTTAGGRVYTIA